MLKNNGLTPLSILILVSCLFAPVRPLLAEGTPAVAPDDAAARARAVWSQSEGAPLPPELRGDAGASSGDEVVCRRLAVPGSARKRTFCRTRQELDALAAWAAEVRAREVPR